MLGKTGQEEDEVKVDWKGNERPVSSRSPLQPSLDRSSPPARPSRLFNSS